MGAPDKALTLYICWLVPSTLSFVLSLYLANYILSKRKSSKKKLQKFQALVLALCLADIVKSGCWFLGEKYTNPYDLCYTQEIMMQTGTLYQNYTCLLICILAYAAVSSVDSKFYKDLLKSKGNFRCIAACVLFIPTVCVISSACLQSPKLWCNIDMPVYHTAPKDVQIAIVAYNVCFFVPHFLAIFVEIGFCIAIKRKYTVVEIRIRESVSISMDEVKRSTSTSSETAVDHLSHLALAQKLLVYPIVFIIGWIPDWVTLIVSLTNGFESTPTRGIANVSAGTVGIAIVTMYFLTNHSKSDRKSDVWRESNDTAGNNPFSAAISSNPLVTKDIDIEIGGTSGSKNVVDAS